MSGRPQPTAHGQVHAPTGWRFPVSLAELRSGVRQGGPRGCACQPRLGLTLGSGDSPCSMPSLCGLQGPECSPLLPGVRDAGKELGVASQRGTSSRRERKQFAAVGVSG